jgi:autotransporter-associated beta strand protein
MTYGVTASFLASGQTLVLGNSYANGTVDFQNGLDFNNAEQTIRVDRSALAGNSDYDAQISGAITNGSLLKTGAGVLRLTAANTYAGTTTVSGGTLLVNGSLAAGSAVTVSTGASLGGGGTINGTVAVNGSLNPGNSIGTLTVANDVTWNGTAGQDWKFELGAISGSSDLLLLTGAGNDFLKGTGSDFRFDFLNTGVVGTFTLVDWASSTTFSALDFSYTGLASGLTGSFALNGSQLDFTVTAVPEPSAYALLLGGLGVLYCLRRRDSKNR